MVVLIHVIIALASIGCASYAFFAPSKTRLRLAQGLVAGTLLSGTYLVLSTRASLVSACVTGLIYISGVSLVLVSARGKLATAQSRDDKIS